jgi:flavin-dependent dehydrogenase
MSFKIIKNSRPRVGIVGAGPAGAMSAYLLASKGYSVTLIERRKEVERKVCGEYLCPEGVKLLKELNLFEGLCSGFSELRGMVLVSPKDEVVPSYFPQKLNSKNDNGLSLNRKLFDQRVLKLALDHGAQLLSNKTIASVAQNSDGTWMVSDTNDGQYTFDLLIAADGRQSKIGHFLGHLKAIDTNRAAIHCYLPRKLDRGQRLGEMHILKDNRYCGLDPISDDEVNFSIVCDSKILKEESPVDIINEAIRNSKRLSSMFDLIDKEKSNDIKIVSSLKNKNFFIAGNNLAYVGDAAGFIDPLTGEGIYNALLSSQLLVTNIMNSSSLEEALANYKKQKKKLSFQKNILNNFFQFLIRRPLLVNLTAKYLKKSPEKANQFIGIIGNVHSPVVGLIKMLAA